MLYILYVNVMGARAGRAAATRAAILAATRELVAAGSSPYPTVGEVATRAGLSRLSVYHHFGSHAGLLEALAAENRPPPHPNAEAGGLEDVQAWIRQACEHWARDPALFRRLPAAAEPGSPEQDRQLAQWLPA